jgi:hypothetical protein
VLVLGSVADDPIESPVLPEGITSTHAPPKEPANWPYLRPESQVPSGNEQNPDGSHIPSPHWSFD